MNRRHAGDLWTTSLRRVRSIRRPYLVIAGSLALLAVVESVWHGAAAAAVRGFDQPLFIAAFAVLALGTTLPVTVSPKQPVMAAAIVSTMIVLSLSAFETLTIAGVAAQLISVERLGHRGRWRPAVLISVQFPILIVVAEFVGFNSAYTTGELRIPALLLACLAPAAALAGVAAHWHREAADNRAARQVIADTLVKHTAREERARIARELHDVVAHHISMVAVQAETARLATRDLPAEGAVRLSAIGDTARTALTEMRRLLGVLREDTETVAVKRQPQPGLSIAELNELIDEARRASGGAARLILRGRPVSLDPVVELAVYRIIQEALTNARRHAPSAAVDVELHYTGRVLELLIRDNGPGPADTASGGHGLSGMRERAAAVDGELYTGPAPGGGFRVEARFPGRNVAIR